ncbi:MAG TPA: 4-alpha-glucanotransferase, partial [Chloroflexota bacterium]|nr:4-alpha-glucanotransferase [Chloroflexota bacterium]
GRWLQHAGFRALQLLPISTLPTGETSPYSALSAMAIDPVYVSMPDVHDFQALGGDVRLPLADQIALRSARTAARVEYGEVRQAKEAALRLSFSLFYDVDWLRGTARAGSFAAFASWEDWWLGDYALYCALRASHGGRAWPDWPERVRSRQPAALDEARGQLDREILFHQYAQWLADEQWTTARERLGEIRLFGDVPFTVGTDSADVWANQHLFRFDRTTGTPPDAFSATGQDWGLPAYNWEAMARDDYRWLRQRGRRMSRLYDGYRLDHLVGFFRTYSRPLGEKEGSFEPAAEDDQIRQGERVLRLFQETGSEITGEDLGLIPDFVRESLRRFLMPGYKVIRWERDWRQPSHPFVPPSRYPGVSVATTSTHDIEPMALWWETAGADEKRAIAAVFDEPLDPSGADPAALPFTAQVRHQLLRAAYGAGSNLLLLPMQDACGWRDRINVPATVGADNWSWRLPIALESMDADETLSACADSLRALAESSGRHA